MATSSGKSRSAKPSSSAKKTKHHIRQRKRRSKVLLAAEANVEKTSGPGSPQITRPAGVLDIDLLKHAKDDTAASALQDLASDALEDNTAWTSGLTKYAQWRIDFRDCPASAFQNGVCEGVKGRWLDEGQDDDRKLLKPTGLIWS